MTAGWAGRSQPVAAGEPGRHRLRHARPMLAVGCGRSVTWASFCRPPGTGARAGRT